MSHSRAALAATWSSISGVEPKELIITATFAASGASLAGLVVASCFASDPSGSGADIFPARHLMYPTF